MTMSNATSTCQHCGIRPRDLNSTCAVCREHGVPADYNGETRGDAFVVRAFQANRRCVVVERTAKRAWIACFRNATGEVGVQCVPLSKIHFERSGEKITEVGRHRPASFAAEKAVADAKAAQAKLDASRKAHTRTVGNAVFVAKKFVPTHVPTESWGYGETREVAGFQGLVIGYNEKTRESTVLVVSDLYQTTRHALNRVYWQTRRDASEECEKRRGTRYVHEDAIRDAAYEAAQAKLDAGLDAVPTDLRTVTVTVLASKLLAEGHSWARLPHGLEGKHRYQTRREDR